MSDPNIKKAAMNSMMANYTNNPNQKQHNISFFKALAGNKDVQNAAITVAKDKQVQKAAYNQVKKNAPLIKSVAVGAFKFAYSASKTSNNQQNTKY